MAFKPQNPLSTKLPGPCYYGDTLYNYAAQSSPTVGISKVNFNGQLCPTG